MVDDLPWITLSYGQLPDSQLIQDRIEGTHYNISYRDQDTHDVFVAAINQGIDSYLEAIFFNQHEENGRFHLEIEKRSMPVLLRRLTEAGTDEADAWASSILQTLNIEWI